jgi:hypothetical protein
MSNITFLQQSDIMYIAFDSFPTLSFNKDKMKFQENAQLIFPIDDKIICCVGSRRIINNIMCDYMVNLDRSIELLSDIAMGYFGDWVKYNPDNIQEGVVEIFVAAALNGQVVTYCISPGNKFEPVKNMIEAGKRSVWSIGGKSDEAKLTTISLLDQNLPMQHLFPTVFHSLKCAEIGGVLTVYQIDKFGTCLHSRLPIQDEDKINFTGRGLHLDG